MNYIIILVILLGAVILVADEPAKEDSSNENSQGKEDDAVLQAHRFFAADFFNKCWDYIDKADRTPADDLQMIHLAHASRTHWQAIGTPDNFAVGDWQISRVYAILNYPAQALIYGQSCLDVCLDNGIEGFNLGFAYEALARAEFLQGNLDNCQKYIDLGKKEAAKVQKSEDREYLLSELNNIVK